MDSGQAVRDFKIEFFDNQRRPLTVFADPECTKPLDGVVFIKDGNVPAVFVMRERTGCCIPAPIAADEHDDVRKVCEAAGAVLPQPSRALVGLMEDLANAGKQVTEVTDVHRQLGRAE